MDYFPSALYGRFCWVPYVWVVSSFLETTRLNSQWRCYKGGNLYDHDDNAVGGYCQIKGGANAVWLPHIISLCEHDGYDGYDVYDGYYDDDAGNDHDDHDHGVFLGG